MKIVSKVTKIAALVVLGFASFSLTAHAANVVAPDDSNFLVDALKSVYDAISTHQWSLTGALAIIYLVAVIKRYLGDKVAFLHSDAGGSLLALVGAVGTALATSLTPGAHLTPDLLLKALQAGVAAAGGYAILKNLLVDPVLKPMVAKLPPWAQTLANLVLFAFDHGTSGATPPAAATAEKAGAAAVAATPGPGIAGIVGKPAELP